MFNIFDHPAGLLILAVVALLILLIIRAFTSEKTYWWQWHLLIFLVGLFFILNFLIKNGLMKINKTTTLGLQIVLIAAAAALFIFLIISEIRIDKRYWWQWFIPILIAFAGFGLDRLVETDIEKIKTLLKTASKAIESEDCSALSELIAPNYRDSYHNSKRELMNYCNSIMSQPLITDNTKLHQRIREDSPKATVTLTTRMYFEKQSFAYQYRPSILIKMKFDLQKQPDKNWLINCAEILQIDMQSVNWNYVK